MEKPSSLQRVNYSDMESFRFYDDLIYLKATSHTIVMNGKRSSEALSHSSRDQWWSDLYLRPPRDTGPFGRYDFSPRVARKIRKIVKEGLVPTSPDSRVLVEQRQVEKLNALRLPPGTKIRLNVDLEHCVERPRTPRRRREYHSDSSSPV